MVMLGLALNAYGRSRISPDAQLAVKQFWASADFIANILIFFATGLIIVGQVRFAVNFGAQGVLCTLLKYLKYLKSMHWRHGRRKASAYWPWRAVRGEADLRGRCLHQHHKSYSCQGHNHRGTGESTIMDYGAVQWLQT